MGKIDIEDEAIDYVFPYCDFKDNSWRNSYLKCLESIGRKFDDEEARRHIDNLGTVKYSLRSIDRYLPWIRNVYMIVDRPSQIPSWLNVDNVKIVFLNEIFPEEMLPCFNSVAIEHYISRITRLSEKFLYGNDDFIALKPLIRQMFFKDDGKLNIAIEKFDLRDYQYHKIIMNAWKFLYDRYGKKYPDDFKNKAYEQYNLHAFRPQLKSIREKMLVTYEKDIKKTFSRTRSEKNLAVMDLPYYYLNGYMTDRIELPFKFHKYQTINNDFELQNFKNVFIRNDFYTIVINEITENYVDQVLEILENKFNFKSKYEL